MAGRLKHWGNLSVSRATAWVLLGFFLFAATHSLWHPHPPGSRCLICQVSRQPQVAQAIAVFIAAVFIVTDRLRTPKPARVASRAIRARSGRSPPA